MIMKIYSGDILSIEKNELVTNSYVVADNTKNQINFYFSYWYFPIGE